MFLKLQTYWRLGFVNIARVTLYRLGLRLGLHPAMRVKASIGGNQFFKQPSQLDVSLKASKAWDEDALYFGWHKVLLQG